MLSDWACSRVLLAVKSILAKKGCVIAGHTPSGRSAVHICSLSKLYSRTQKLRPGLGTARVHSALYHSGSAMLMESLCRAALS